MEFCIKELEIYRATHHSRTGLRDFCTGDRQPIGVDVVLSLEGAVECVKNVFQAEGTHCRPTDTVPATHIGKHTFKAQFVIGQTVLQQLY